MKKFRKQAAGGMLALSLSASALALTPPMAYAAPNDPGPVVGSATATNGTFKLTWNEVQHATNYRVEISSNADFTGPLLEEADLSGRTYQTRANYATTQARVIYWRVAAYGAGRDRNTLTAWSKGTPIELSGKAGPTKVSPGVNANDLEVNYPKAVSFQWNPLPSAIEYEVQWAPGGDFNSNKTVSQWTTGTTVTPKNRIVAGDWSWRVRAKLFSTGGENNYSDWSTTSNFKIQWRDADSLVKLKQVSGSPSYVDNPVSDPVFSWDPVEGAAYYKITIARDSEFTNILVNDTNVYGTVYTPAGYFLNGEYFYKVVAYDAAGNPGARASEPARFTMNWGMDSSKVQSLSAEARPVPVGTVGSTSSVSAPSIPANDFRLSWQPIPRATKYRVSVKALGHSGDWWSCETTNTVATPVDEHIGGPQTPYLYSGDGTCFRGWPTTGDESTTYMWRVQAVNFSGSGESYSQGELVSAESTPRYFKLSSTNGGGSVSNVNWLAAGTWASGKAAIQENVKSASPELVWRGIDPTFCDGRYRYEVRFYRTQNNSTSVHIATFRTSNNRMVLPGMFRDDNSSTPYHARIRVTCGGLYYGHEWDSDELDTVSWRRKSNTVEFGNSYETTYNGQKLLSWTPQFDTDHLDSNGELLYNNKVAPASALGYLLRYKLKGSTQWEEVRTEYPYWMAVNNWGNPLGAGAYSFQVSVVESNGQAGRWSEEKDFTIAPSVPTGLQATTTGSNTVTLNWNNSDVAEGYEIATRPVGATEWSVPWGGFTEQNKFTFENLNTGRHEFRIRARTKGDNWSQWTTAQEVNVAAKAVTLTSVDGVKLSTSNRTLTWNAVAGASRYRVQISDNAGAVLTTGSVETVGTSYTPTEEFPAGKTFYWRVTALAEPAGWNPMTIGASDVRSFSYRTLPATPGGLYVEREGRDARLKWGALQGEFKGDSGAVSYLVRYRENGTEAWTTLAKTGPDASEMLIKSLGNNKNYQFQVAAINGEGYSGWSGIVDMTTLSTPAAVNGLKAIGGSSSSLTMAWDWPSSDGGSNLLKFQIKWRKQGSSAWKTHTTQGLDPREYKINGLSANTPYQVEVRAINAIGEGEAAVVAYRTHGVAPKAPNVKLKAKKGKTVVSWSAASSPTSKVSAYRIQYSSNGKSWRNLKTVNGNTRKLTAKVGKKGKRVYFRVAAYNASGWSKPSTAKSVKRR